MRKFLTDGLVLRRATPADTDALVPFNADVLRHQDAEEPDPLTAAWTRDLMERRHPSVNAGDFTVVEDPRTGAIVASVVLISQTWSYGGIELGVGQPELVGTRPEYRGRGLVRQQFEVIHQWSAARGHMAQAIDGIPWFYRQFGYEMALSLRGGRTVATSELPAPDHSNAEPHQVRPAVDSDLAFIAPAYEYGAARYLVTCRRDQTLWHYELRGRSSLNMYRAELGVVETRDRQPVGFLAHLPRLVGPTLWVIAYELKSGVAWQEVTRSVLRYLRATGEAYAARRAGDECRYIGFGFDTEHPGYALLDTLGAQVEPPYAWYVRVANLPKFLRHVAPALERRLADSSALAGYTGELRISFYRDGLRLVFERGRLAEVIGWQPPFRLLGVERWQSTTAERPAAAFPGLTFLQLLFGYRSLDELEYAFPDCLVRTDETRALLLVLFPKQASNVWPVL